MVRNPIAALAGLATYNHDSGPKNGKRYIKGGRAKVREALYMAMQSAFRFNPIISSHYNKLISKNKPHKVATIACMRKLLIHLHFKLRNEFYLKKNTVLLNQST